MSYFYAELTPTNAVLLLISILIAGGPMPPFLVSRPAWLKITLRTLLALLPQALALAQALAATQAQSPSNPYAL